MVDKRAGEFYDIGVGSGQRKTLVRPEFAADERERIREGGLSLRVPGGPADGRWRPFRLLVGVARDQREQSKQRRGGATDGQVRPLALSLDAEMSSGLLEAPTCGGYPFELPAQDEPGEDLRRVRVLIRAAQGSGGEGALGSRISTQRSGAAGMPPWYQTVVSDATSTVRSPWPYQSATVTPVHTVVGSPARMARVGRRWPLRRGRPTCPGARAGAGSYSAASRRSRVTTVTGFAQERQAARNSRAA